MIQAIITYRNNGSRRPGGQQVGSDGRGDFAVLIDEETIEKGILSADIFLTKLKTYAEYKGHIDNIMVVYNQESYLGNCIKTLKGGEWL